MISKKYLFVLLSLGLLGGLVYILYRPINTTSQKDYIINLDNDSIYMRTLIWGVSGGNEAILVSNKPISNDVFYYDANKKSYVYKDEKEILVYHQAEIYYKKQADTLFIFSRSKPDGKLFEYSDKIKIVPIECKINEWHSLKKNHMKSDLIKIENR